MKKLLFLFLVTALINGAFAQSRATIEAYILKYRDIAIEEMQRTGVPASITLAQGIHETGAGTSELVLKSNNHFGIKCKTEWEGEKVYHDDDARGECFRKYDDPSVSYKDHSDFLKNRPYYASLFKLDPTDYEAWAFGLKKAGYATNPKYPQILIKLIRDYNLQDYTLIAMGRKQPDLNIATWAKSGDAADEPGVELGVTGTPKAVYPEGEFRINDTRVIYIQKGTSYLKIAEDYDISLARLLDFNDMKDGDIAATDGLLFLGRKRKAGAHEFHTVSAGETLYEIAQSEGIRFESLLQYNFLTPTAQVEAGEKLYLSTAAPSAPKLATVKAKITKAVFKTPELPTGTVANGGYLLHTVQPKETVYSIAKKYEVGVDDVKKWNELGTSDLKIGQQVRIKQTN
jgi:LysM repeat protein